MKNKDIFNWIAVDSAEEYQGIRNYLINHQPQIKELMAIIVDNPTNKQVKKSDTLTQRELEVLKLLMEYKTNVEIADELFVSVNTVKKHVGSIINKLEVYDRICAVEKATRTNILRKE